MAEICGLCPRRCAVSRDTQRGFCGEGTAVRIGRASLHPWEEPPISGTRGSGTVFFSGCSLRCVFCQNRAIRPSESGRALSVEELASVFLALREQGAHNINLVTPTHYADRIAEALRLVKGDRKSVV